MRFLSTENLGVDHGQLKDVSRNDFDDKRWPEIATTTQAGNTYISESWSKFQTQIRSLRLYESSKKCPKVVATKSDIRNFRDVSVTSYRNMYSVGGLTTQCYI